MKEEDIKELFEQFEAIANEYEGVECWSARELAQVLGYSKWERFEGVSSSELKMLVLTLAKW